MSRFRRKVIIVVSFILSAVGAIGALLLSDNDDDKGKMNLTNCGFSKIQQKCNENEILETHYVDSLC